MPAEEPSADKKSVNNFRLEDNFPNWFRDWLLPLCVVIIAASVIFVIGFYQYNNFKKTDISDFSDTSLFSNESHFEKYKQFLESNTDEGALKAFSLLSNEYIYKPSNDKHKALEKLAKYISLNFPNNIEAAKIKVPCREESCGQKIEFDQELVQIKQSVENSTEIDDFEKQSLILNLENAAIAKDQGNKIDEFNSLSVSFQQLRVIYKQKNSDSIKIIAENILRLLERIDKSTFDIGVLRGTFVI